MDALSGFLTVPRARGAFLLRSVLSAPWSLRIEDRAPLTIACVVQGEMWVRGRGAPAHLGPSDIALISGSEPYIVADSPRTLPQVVIGPDQVCTDLGTGAELTEQLSFGVRSWGNDRNGATVLLTGTYQHSGEVSRRLLDALPEMIVVTGDEWDSPLIALLADEIGRDALGQEVVLDRMLDLLTVSVLREWLDRPDVRAPAWYTAHSDPVVGAAMRLIHSQPAHPWTVASLADTVGVSRAALARRFTELVGESPIAFLTEYRLAVAADLLRDPDATVARVAREIGYGSPFTFSTAFKRRYGRSPQQHRIAQTG